MKRFSVFAFAFAALVACAVSCEKSATAPKISIQRIALGSVTNGSLGASDSARLYSFGASGGSGYTVFVKLLDLSRVQVDLQDSAGTTVIASAVVSPSTFPLDQSAAIAFTAPASGEYTLAVRPHPAGQAASFQLQIVAVSEAPEARAAVFAIGDTVSGESLRPVGDVDVFNTHTDSARDIVVVAEAPDSTGLGPLQVSVIDSSSGAVVSTTYFATGAPARLTSGRIHLPGAGTYLFRLSDSSATVVGAFHGSYRFWTYAIKHAPEHVSAQAPCRPGSAGVVTGESIDRTGDMDEFTFGQAQLCSWVNLFFQSRAPSHLDVLFPSGGAHVSVAAGPDTGLYARFTGRTALGILEVRVTGDGLALADTGAYRFLAYPIDERPESVSIAVAPGDSVTGEAIDLPGDIDEFTLPAAPGQQYYAYLQARSGLARTHLVLAALDPSWVPMDSTQSTGTDTSLLGHVPAIFTEPATGTTYLRVWGAGGDTSGSYGPYRLFVWPVNPKPESHPDTLAFGDSVFTQAIDVPGDVDEYRFHVRDSSGANLVTSFLGVPAAGGVLHTDIVDSVSGAVVTSTDSWGSGRTQTGAVPLKPGTYILRVQASSGVGAPYLRGPYRVWLYGFHYGPESVRDTIAIGDTVSAEALDVPGDVDTYHFYGQRGQHIRVHLESLGASDPGFAAYVAVPSGPVYWQLRSQVSRETSRLDLPFTGWYTVTVTGGATPPTLDEVGPYRLALVSVSTAPEHVSSTLAIGDSVTAESIDTIGDWDQFTVAATPGQELNILFWAPPSGPDYPRLLAFDPATWDTLATSVGQGWHVTQAVRVPPGGQIGIAVYGSAPTLGDYTGPYVLQVLALNRAPEVAPAAYTLGDTVRTESVYPAGDIDEFTLTATPGDTLSAWFRLPANPAPVGVYLSLEVVDAANGSVLIGSNTGVLGTTPGFNRIGTFVVPQSGSLIVRFRGTEVDGYEMGTGPYEFFVKRGP